MTLIVNTCVFIFILSVIFSDITASKPKITPGGEKIIQEGEELRIECRGQGRLQFSIQEITEPEVEPSDYTVSFDEASGAYTFLRPRTTRRDTGWYACANEGILITNDEQTIDHPSENISWIYVYVNSSEPFAVMEAFYAAVTTVANGSVVIPCRPTSPKLPVVLLDSNEKVVPVAGNISYDPKIGFIMAYVDGSQEGAGYGCNIQGGNLTSYPLYNLDVKAVDAVPLAAIKTEDLIRAVLGKHLTLHCNITMYKGSNVHLSWKAPESVPEGRLLRNSSSTRLFHDDIISTNLTIINVEEGDAGEYFCEANGTFESAHASTIVRVMDPDHPFINATVAENQTLIKSWEHTEAKWKITISAFPSPKIEWCKDGKPISNVGSQSTDSSSTKHSVRIEQETHLYKISDLNISDTANYTIQITTANQLEVIPLQLIVYARPVSRIYSDKLFYKPGDLALFSCNTTALPTPNVTWSFSERLSGENHTSRVPLNVTPAESEPVKSGSFSVEYRLNLPITAMGNLTCRSCNIINETEGCIEVTEPVFVSDGNGIFGTDCNPPEVVEGENITLKCVASVYNYTKKVGWKSKDSKDLVLIPGRMTLRDVVTTKFTSQSILEIREVSKRDAGSYSCEATSKAGDTNRTNYNLTVLASFKPSVNEIILDKSRAHVKLDKDAYPIRTLSCEAQGSPRPTLTWLKGGKLLADYPELKYNLSSNDTKLTIGPLRQEDGGNYSCVAKNRLGRVERWVNIEIEGKSENTGLWIGLVCVLIFIIIIVITSLGIKVHRERKLRQELFDAGLTHFEEGALECLNPDLTVDEQAELLPYDKKWEFPRELLKLGKQLGSGAFGVVMKAEARGILVEEETTTVAVKMVRRSADPSYMKALSSELKIMIHLGRHLNVVNLLGACTKTILSKRELYVIVEYCRFGNLHNYLQRHRGSFIDQIDPTTQKIDPEIGKERLIRSESVSSQNRVLRSFSRSLSVTSSGSNSGTDLVYYHQGPDSGDVNMSPDGGILSNNSVQPGWRSNYRGDYRDQNLIPICTQDLLCWAWQVACGMKYLSDRNVLHGDLAARNILLADDNVVKICDFGLAKNMYKDNNYKKKGEGPLPIKWMAVESIRDRIFSTQSDVWSFGIVLWEFFTLARTPYPGMEAEKQYDRLIEGYRMEKPDYATDEIYDFMQSCWKAKPSLRPLFPELAEKLGALLNDATRMHFLDLNTPYLDMNTLNLQNGQTDYLTMMSTPDHDYYNGPDPEAEVDPSVTTNYMAMSPAPKTNDSCIFSPRSEIEEVQFDFPPPSEIIIPSNILKAEGPGKNPDDSRQEKGALIDLHQKTTPIEGESGYSTGSSSPQYSNWKNQSSGDSSGKDSEKNLNGINFLKDNNTGLTSPTIHAENNYINMPTKKSNPPVKDAIDAFSNPSYVIMSKPEESR